MAMRKLNIPLKLSAAAIIGWLGCNPALAAPNCTGLQGQTIGDAHITAATEVSGSLDVVDLSPFGIFSGRKPGPVTITDLPAMCRVVGSIRVNPTSNNEFELWLPMSGWNNRMVMWGNGGPAGFISYGTPELPMMQGAVRAGYATVSTNTGHWRTLHDVPMSFPKMSDEAYIDFGYRSIHVTAVAAKAITRSFYSSAPQYSYFSGCSTGGRQGMMAARRYPTDFNGILTGAGVYNFGVIGPLAQWRAAIRGAAGLTPAVGKIVMAGVTAQCGGTSEGYVRDPDQCHLDTAKLVCKPGDAAGQCLTPDQAIGVQRLIDGPLDAAGRPLGFGTAPVALDFTPSPLPLPVTFDFAAASRAMNGEMHAGESNAQYMDGAGTDIAPFFAAGGKMLMFHGWVDSGVPVANSITAFDGIRERIGAAKADKQVRLFLAPGMGHCAMGNGGGNFFGQYDVPGPGKTDPATNVFQALQDWVEHDKAPTHLVATKYEGDNQTKAVIRRTLLCAYPKQAKYNGTGNIEDANSYTCTAPS
jgi:hypothetical protein